MAGVNTTKKLANLNFSQKKFSTQELFTMQTQDNKDIHEAFAKAISIKNLFELLEQLIIKARENNGTTNS